MRHQISDYYFTVALKYIIGTNYICWSSSVPDPGLESLCDQIEGSVKPVVAAIHGCALGGGLELASSAHYRVCHPKAKWVTILGINYSDYGSSIEGGQIELSIAAVSGLRNFVRSTMPQFTQLCKWVSGCRNTSGCGNMWSNSNCSIVECSPEKSSEWTVSTRSKTFGQIRESTKDNLLMLSCIAFIQYWI